MYLDAANVVTRKDLWSLVEGLTVIAIKFDTSISTRKQNKIHLISYTISLPECSFNQNCFSVQIEVLFFFCHFRVEFVVMGVMGGGFYGGGDASNGNFSLAMVLVYLKYKHDS